MDSTVDTAVESTSSPPTAAKGRARVGKRRKGALVARLIGLVVAMALSMTFISAAPASAQTVGYGDIFTDSHVAWYVSEVTTKGYYNQYGYCQTTADLYWNSTNSTVNWNIQGAMSRLKANSGRSGMIVSPGHAQITWIAQTTNQNDLCPNITGHNGNLSALPTWAKDWLAEAVYLVISLGVTAGLMGLAAVYAGWLLTSPWFDGAIGCMAGALGNSAYLLVLGQTKWKEVLSGVVSGCLAGASEVAGIRAIAAWANRIAAGVERQVAAQGILNAGEIDVLMNQWLIEMVNL